MFSSPQSNPSLSGFMIKGAFFALTMLVVGATSSVYAGNNGSSLSTKLEEATSTSTRQVTQQPLQEDATLTTSTPTHTDEGKVSAPTKSMGPTEECMEIILSLGATGKATQGLISKYLAVMSHLTVGAPCDPVLPAEEDLWEGALVITKDSPDFKNRGRSQSYANVPEETAE